MRNRIGNLDCRNVAFFKSIPPDCLCSFRNLIFPFFIFRIRYKSLFIFRKYDAVNRTEKLVIFRNFNILSLNAIDTAVKNPRLKSRASDKKQKPLFVGLRFALIRFLLHLPDALPSGFSLTQALCQDPYPGSPTAVQALKVDFHHGFHASPRYRCFIVWLFPFQECLFACDRF